MDKEFAEAFKEDLELTEMKWEVGGVYHQEFKNGDKVYFKAGSVQKNKRWKGLSVDEFGGRQKKAKSASADEKQQGWETTPKNEIPKGLKEEVEVAEADKEALKRALAISKWKKAGGKIDKQPDNMEKWWGQLSPEDQKRAANIAQYKKEKKQKKEEVEIDEGKFKKGDIVIPNMGPHKGDKHKIIHDFGDGSYNISPQKHSRFIKYKQGAAKAKENQLKLVKEEVEKRWTGGKLPPHLAKFFDKDGNLKKDAAARVAKGREKINWIDVTPKGYGPKEEVEEASTYRDRAKDDEKKKKKHFAFGGKKKSRHGESGYGKGEEVKVDEKKSHTGYELYHKDFSSAMQHAYAHAKKKGHVIDPKEIDDKVATGPKKPSSGKTNRYSLKAGRKKVEIQVANLDNKRYELNMYIESENTASKHPLEVRRKKYVELNKKDALNPFNKIKEAFTRIRSLVKKPEEIEEKLISQTEYFPIVLTKGIRKAIPGVKLVQHKIKHPRSGETIPGLGLQLPGDKGIRIMVQYEKDTEPPAKSYGSGEKIVDIDPKTGKKEVTDTNAGQIGFTVWVNDVGKEWKKNEVRWILKKEFRDPKKVVQFLKTKVKRIAKEGIDIEKASMGAVIKDFQDSDAPQFKGKSDKKRKEMAIAAKLSKEEKEETDDPKSKKKDKINLKPKMDETMKNYKEFMKKVQEVKDKDPDKEGTQGDNAEWKKARSGVLKKYGVASCAFIKDDKTKKQCFKDLDDAHVADHEEQVKKEEVEVSENIKNYKDVVSKILGRRKEVKEAVTTGGIEYGEQDWDVGYRLDNIAPYMDSNFAEFHEQGLEGPYLWHGETYFFDRKVGSWYSVTAEDFVDDEISKDLSLAYVKDGMYKRQFAS